MNKSAIDHSSPTHFDQKLHLVFGGELAQLDSDIFRDTKALDIVGIFPDYQSALFAWRAKAQQTVDNAHMRYYIVQLENFAGQAHY